MNVYTEMVGVLDRLAAATSISRTRLQEQTRAEVNGGSMSDLQQRVRKVIERLEQNVDELEKTLR